MEIGVVEVLFAVEGKGKELKKALSDLVPKCRVMPGCLQYDLFEPQDGKEEFLIFMRWKSEKDLRRHESALYNLEFVKKFDNILYKGFSQSEWNRVV